MNRDAVFARNPVFEEDRRRIRRRKKRMNRKTLIRLPLVLLVTLLALLLLPSLSWADPPANGCEVDPDRKSVV